MGSKEALISELGYRKIKSNQIEVQQKSLKKNEQNFNRVTRSRNPKYM